jgi:DNA-binding CsgD family transcriptional regulator
MTNNQNYILYRQFIDRYKESGFKDIDRSSAFIKEVEQLSEKNDQFFCVGDVIRIKYLWTSKRSAEMMGIEPDQFDPYCQYDATHPDDLRKHALRRLKLFDFTNEFYLARKGEILMSTDVRIKNRLGVYQNMFFQLYLFYSEAFNTVFLFQLHTNIDSFENIKPGQHDYAGTDFSKFRFPDKELLTTGSAFSERETEIIRLVDKGLTSQEIADKLFLSKNTVSTHRSNILHKSGNRSFNELLHQLKKLGEI